MSINSFKLRLNKQSFWNFKYLFGSKEVQIQFKTFCCSLTAVTCILKLFFNLFHAYKHNLNSLCGNYINLFCFYFVVFFLKRSILCCKASYRLVHYLFYIFIDEVLSTVWFYYKYLMR